MVLHLLDQLARELDRLDVRPKGAAEDALEQALDPVLDVPEDAHAAGVMPPAGTLTPGLERQDDAGGPGGDDERRSRDGGCRQERERDHGGAEAGDSPGAPGAGERHRDRCGREDERFEE